MMEYWIWSRRVHYLDEDKRPICHSKVDIHEELIVTEVSGRNMENMCSRCVKAKSV